MAAEISSLTLPGGTRVGAPPVVRVAGLPVRVLRGLRFERSFTALNEIAEHHHRLESEARQLADALYDVIGTLPDGPPKPHMVGLRRALHRPRAPRETEWNPIVARALPLDLADHVRRWISDFLEAPGEIERLQEVFAAEREERLDSLRAAARHPNLRRGLAQASPSLSAEVSAWLGGAPRAPRFRAQVALASYVARASAKTSPYSTFMVSGLGEWSADGPAVRIVDRPRVRAVVELDGAFVQGLVRSLSTDPELRRSLPLRLNPSATFTGDRVSFVGPRPDEAIMTMPATAALRACAGILERGTACPRANLRDALTRLGNAPGADVEAFLDGLVELGLLEVVPPTPDLAKAPLDALARWLAETRDARLTPLATLIGELHDEAGRDVPVDDLAGHGQRQRHLTRLLDRVATHVALPTKVDARTAKWAFHESSVHVQPATACAVTRWHPALKDLDAVRRWLALFDPSLPLKLAFAEFFRERFGPGTAVPFLAAHRALHQELRHGDDGGRTPAAREVVRLMHARTQLLRPLTGSQLPRLRELAHLQDAARDAVLSTDVRDGVVHVDPTEMVAWATIWPRWVETSPSVACYLQATNRERDPSLVLNAMHNGHGRGRSRVAHLVDRAGGIPPADRQPSAPAAGPLMAELSGQFGSTVNVRTAAVSHELDYPFTSSTRPDSERIRLGDCVVVHDDSVGLLRLRSESREVGVVPLHVGMMGDLFLPSAAQFLTQVFGHSFYTYPHVALVADNELTTPESVTAYRRVAVGSVVLRRACWVAPADQVPRRPSGESDTQYWLRLLRWLRTHRVPTQCFVRVWASAPGSDGSRHTDPDWLWGKGHKPFYVDFANWFLVAAFERMVGGTSAMAVFEEALPAPDQASAPEADPAVTEFLVELSDPGS
ncbi:lantibiotic dehydratase [Spiractinospora alimapuensis]|uniref:lantibiotic dehydratase n=1 Tax=Spiractinospora alimapuensis TaxID=2820884 RepID=UPI001F2F39A3|nr:lantibiotic dehydratase [Spiractinospora alimapuensis]QVQ51272.1 lantibiotic dehydratase [Spiractinospora alimapuensis]